MNIRNVDTDVLIVGAGPVGLFLANECVRRHLKFRIIEKRPTQSQHSKALAIFPRTLEIFDMAGVVAPFLDIANRVTSVDVITHGRTLTEMPFTPEGSLYPFIAMVPQDVTEKLLAEHLRNRGSVIDYETCFVSAIQNDDHVSVTLDRAGKQEQLTAAFVIGCDGPHSPVRHILNLPFEGAEYPNLFLLADIETNNGLPVDHMQLCPHQRGPLAIFPMSATRRRIVAMIPKPEGDVPSLDLVRRMLVERAPRTIEAHSMYWSSYFHIHHRYVSQLRERRIFIAGDAAHIHSPFGGQGMNTGLHDVWNLVWKLDLFLRGQGNDRLLDSYSAERLPVIKQVVETTDRMTKIMGTPSKLAQILRDTVVPLVSGFSPFQHAFVERLSGLGIAYGHSPVIDGDGRRYMDLSMSGGSGVLGRFLLLLHEGANPSVVVAARRMVDSFAQVVELRLCNVPGVTLVRPDGYVAYFGSLDDALSALASMRELLVHQTESAVETAS